ncbi:MAG: RagB/SusD family nutrient uptake outer membrane protein [Ferruginibacter sp.]
MKNIRKYIPLIACLIALTQTGCNKLVDLKPINEISDASYWKSPDQFKQAANEFYNYLITFGNVLYDGPHSDLRSDLTPSRSVFSNGTNTVPQTDGSWNGAFGRIRSINYLLDRAAAYSTPSDIKIYVAEAKFFRAYVYFDLLEQFGGVPVIDKLLSTDATELQGPRNSRDETVDFIIKNLEEAINDLPATNTIASIDKGRISKEAAQAFLGRVTLYEGTWQKFRTNAARANAMLDKAIASSDAVITGNQFQLFAPAVLGDSALKYLFVLEDEKSNPAGIGKSANKEYILSNRYSYSQRQIRNNVTHTWLGGGSVRKFANMFLSEDGLPIEKSPLFQGYATTRSEYFNRDHRMQFTMMIDSNYYWDNENPGSRVTWIGDAADIANSRGRHRSGGYNTQKWGTERRLQDNEEGYDWPVIRLAEVYLNYAEAVYERNGVITDGDLDKSLNLVRNRVNKSMPKLSNGFVTANGLDMRTEIRRERAIELCLEGFRLDDLKRWKTAETEMPMNVLSIKWKGTTWETRLNTNGNPPFPLDADGNLIVEGGRKWDAKNYLLPIPTQQIQLNPNLVQNPNW